MTDERIANLAFQAAYMDSRHLTSLPAEGSKITPEAAQRLNETPSPQVLRAMRELEMMILQKRVNKLREALDADQSDIDMAFEADRLPCPKGWDTSI